MPVFALPLALLGLAGIPALAGIYWLRNRHRRRVVSSLLLWSDLTRPKEGGTRVQRFDTPLLLLLELLAIGLLVLAASDPRVLASEAQRPLVVVLDDSYSMQARVDGETTARDAGARAVMEALADEPRLAVRFVLAGPRPRAVGGAVGTLEEAAAVLEEWNPRAATADVEAAVALAGELGGGLGGRVMVVTDHAPPNPEAEEGDEAGRVVWRAVGKASGNAAMVNAVRGVGGDEGGERVLLEAANLSDASRPVTLATQGGAEESLELEAGEVLPTWLSLSGASAEAAVRAGVTSQGDPLAMDDAVTLLPPPGRVVSVRVDLTDEALREAVTRALDASRLARRVSQGEALTITDGEVGAGSSRAWTLRFIAPAGEKGSGVVSSEAGSDNVPDVGEASEETVSDTVSQAVRAYVGPFVVERSHPLAEGLSLDGVVWATTPEESVAGVAVVSAGNVPLLTDAAVTRGGSRVHLIRLRLDPSRSTLQDTPNLPVLIYNMLAWRASAMTGAAGVNARLGSRVELAIDERIADAELTDPDGKMTTLSVVRGRIAFDAAVPGTYRVTTPEVERVNAGGEREVAVAPAETVIAVNPLSLAESDLRNAASGTWGTWQTQESLRTEYRTVAWMLLLAVAGLLALHAWLLHRRGGGT